jgi:hypothetical protein
MKECKTDVGGVLKKDDIRVESDRYFTVVTSTVGNLAAMYFQEGKKESREKDSKK